jgi:hypothetical protein
MSKPKYHDGNGDWRPYLRDPFSIIVRANRVVADKNKESRWIEAYLDDLEAACLSIDRKDLRDAIVAVRVWWELGE